MVKTKQIWFSLLYHITKLHAFWYNCILYWNSHGWLHLEMRQLCFPWSCDAWNKRATYFFLLNMYFLIPCLCSKFMCAYCAFLMPRGPIHIHNIHNPSGQALVADQPHFCYSLGSMCAPCSSVSNIQRAPFLPVFGERLTHVTLKALDRTRHQVIHWNCIKNKRIYLMY